MKGYFGGAGPVGLEAMHSTAVEGAQVWEWLCGFSPRSWCNPDISQSEISEPSERLPSALSPGASSILDFWQLSNNFFIFFFLGKQVWKLWPSMVRGWGVWTLEEAWSGGKDLVFSAEIEVPWAAELAISSRFVVPCLTFLSLMQ